MELETQVLQYIRYPFPLWDLGLIQALVSRKNEDWRQAGLPVGDHYSTMSAYQQGKIIQTPAKQVCVPGPSTIYLEPSSAGLSDFCEVHGLELMTDGELQSWAALDKLKRAFALLARIPDLLPFLSTLVRSVHVLRQDDPDTDCSYSHPKIPFSIFVSIGKGDSLVQDLRVAESILHEALHLMLTLIEETVPLIQEDSNAKYFSPWKQEPRHVRGILHGAYVFRGIYEFLDCVQASVVLRGADLHCTKRMSEIEGEFRILDLKDLEKGLLGPSNALLDNLSKIH
jgi:HEXXH motif-containing protein